MPVFNGEAHVGLALASLREQDYPALEIVISDNASTDRTEEICRAAAAIDSRIRYVRLPSNIGAWGNFRHVFELSHGEYFWWAGHHDLWSPRFVSACAAALDANPEAILSYPESRLIDADGALLEDKNPTLDTTGLALCERLKRMLTAYPVCAIYGLMRAEGIRAVTTAYGLGLNRPLSHVSPDVIFEMKLACLGSFAVVPETLSYLRLLPRPRVPGEKLEELVPSRRAHARWPRVQFLRDVSEVILKNEELNLAERAQIMTVLLRNWGWQRARSYLYELDTLNLVGRAKTLATAFSDAGSKARKAGR